MASISKIGRSAQNGSERNNLWSNIEKGANEIVPGRMESVPGRVDNFAGIKPKRRWRRLREQFETQEGRNDDKRGESHYLYRSFSKDAGGRKFRNLKTLIVKSLIKLIDSS
jgi:hypothetical protein